MTWRDALRPKSVLIDAALILAVLVGANIALSPAHPGWTNANPSPYLLLPALLGGRYGFAVGVLAGVVTSAAVASGQVLAGAGSIRAAWVLQPWLHAAFVIAGGISGELYGWFRRERLQAEAQMEKLQTSVRRLDADVRYLRGVKDELDRTVAARDGEVSALDTELRRLYACPGEDLPGEVLQFLKRQVRLTDAALYAVPAGGGDVTRLALIGRDTHLPPTLDLATHPMVRLALERKSLVTLPELLRHRDPPADEHHLLAAPLRDALQEARFILVVTGLPFITFNPQTVNLIALICDWAGEAMDLARNAADRYRVVGAGQRVFNRQHFRHLLQLALQSYQRHRLPSSVVVFSLPGTPLSEQARFEGVLLRAIRAGDYAAELEHPEPHLAVLLPLVGQRGTDIFIERCRQFLRQNGPWPVPVDVRRVELGRIEELDEIISTIDGTDSR
jgi:hypothetical protein